MKKFLACAVATLAASALYADTLELADGRTLEGDFVGSSNGIIMFNTGEGIEAFPENEVVGLFFSSGVATAEALIESGDANQVTVPSGTRLVIRMSDSLDSNRHSVGHRFRAQLDGAVVVDGVTVLPRGTQLQGQITSSGQARRLAGSSNLSVTFTDVILNDEFVPISTGQLTAQTGDEAGRTVGRTARAAAIGGLISGSSGARTGAAVGAGASILTSGASINIPRGSIIETTLAAPLTVTP
jgi:hypothetical protein